MRRNRYQFAFLSLALFSLVALAAWLVVGNRERSSVSRTSVRAVSSVPVPSRTVYPYSVVDGGLYTRKEAAVAVSSDPVVAVHYAGIQQSQIRPAILESPMAAHVSYRRNGRVYWTAKRVQLPKGEPVLTDGKNLIRARCGNRISEQAQSPVAHDEPQSDVLDTPYEIQPLTAELHSRQTWIPGLGPLGQSASGSAVIPFRETPAALPLAQGSGNAGGSSSSASGGGAGGGGFLAPSQTDQDELAPVALLEPKESVSGVELPALVPAQPVIDQRPQVPLDSIDEGGSPGLLVAGDTVRRPSPDRLPFGRLPQGPTVPGKAPEPKDTDEGPGPAGLTDQGPRPSGETPGSGGSSTQLPNPQNPGFLPDPDPGPTAPTPEPGTLLLVGVASAVLTLRNQRRKRAS